MAQAVIAATAAVLLLTACTPHYQPEPAALQDTVDCSTAVGWNTDAPNPALQQKGRVPKGFIPVDAVLCTWSQQVSASTATTAAKAIVTREHLAGDYTAGDYTALLAALAEPSDRAHNVSCLDYAELVPELWLVNAAGKAINVQWPLDGCENSKPDTAKALAGLTVTETTILPGKATPMKAPQ
ncbi:hypothetical protein [Arthrobacter sp. H35-D1]|uniref:hypothetical protein n=1 Tax=Arthrobacter sp. H35-D1 TaxID=3046202 RepID=UPI0024B8ED37|nr:hypothetical protein [Arthrobacter sp. H35-D1]MDJ0313760.1 hypothetical protein [Arthrobacter sp. H35-D1]